MSCTLRTIAAIAILVSACSASSSTDTTVIVPPLASLTGTYELTAVNGAPLPALCVEVLYVNVPVNGGIVTFTNYDTVSVVSATLKFSATTDSVGAASFVTDTRGPNAKIGKVGSAEMTYRRSGASLTVTTADGVPGTGTITDAGLSINDPSWCLSYGASNMKRFDFRKL